MAWLERIDQAAIVGYFTGLDNREISLATKCFVGEKFPKQACFYEKLPVPLMALGWKAKSAVNHNNVSEARRIYEIVQKFELPEVTVDVFGHHIVWSELSLKE